jgi:acetyl esterase/lipase
MRAMRETKSRPAIQITERVETGETRMRDGMRPWWFACGILTLYGVMAYGQQSSQSAPPVDPKFMAAVMDSIPPKPETLPLYEGAAVPNSKPTADQESVTPPYGMLEHVSRPTIQAFLPAKSKANGASVIIFPGGGYVSLSMYSEGTLVAEYLQDYGIAAFLVKYRLPSDATMENKTIGPLQDAQQAIRLVREHASSWKLDPARVGVLGFSAGGHLAATLGTHLDKSYISNPDGINLRPDFMMLVYPVISMDTKIAHMGSRLALLGPNPTDDQVRLFSNELQVTNKTPPTLLLQATDDHLVDVDNSIVFFEALRHHEVPVDMTIFKKGDHGLFLLPRDRWESMIPEWMQANGWMK